MAAGLPLVLYSKQHDNLGVGESTAQIVRNFYTEIGESVRNKCGGTHQSHIGSHFG